MIRLQNRIEQTPNVLSLSAKQADFLAERLRLPDSISASLNVSVTEVRSVARSLELTLVNRRRLNIDNLNDLERRVIWDAYDGSTRCGNYLDDEEYKEGLKTSRAIYAKFRVAGLVPSNGSIRLVSR